MAAVNTVTGNDIQGKRYLEVVFPRFTYQKPWPKKPGQTEANFFKEPALDLAEFGILQQPILQPPPPTTIPIYRLSHITHESEAEDIPSMDLNTGLILNFNFRPHMKVGKAYVQDGSPLGETYKEIGPNQYQEIPRSYANPVFPGYLSWWGVDVRALQIPRINPIGFYWNPVLEFGQYMPGYLANPVASPYGNRGFSITFGDILRDYKMSRSDKPDKKVCLKVGGTLRYRYEICYVVMVCMEEDDVWGMPSITASPAGPFDPNGLVDCQGVVVNYDQVPTVILHSVVKYSGRINYDWEQLVFSFYFPSADQTLTCNNVEIDDVEHDPPKCTASIRTPEGIMKCPNKLNRPKVV